MIADLYDFDGTVFDGESGGEFFLFCLKRHPKLIKYAPRQFRAMIKYLINKDSMLNYFKTEFYSFLNDVDANKESELFWEKNAHRMNIWFKPSEHDVPSVVCSASPLFQIKPICDKLGVTLIVATDLDEKTGKLKDINCKGENKLEYLKKYAPEYTFRDVYTDNIESDAPILSLAQRNRYKVENGSVTKLN